MTASDFLTFCGFLYRIQTMINFTFWRDGEYFVGFLTDFPEYQTQGLTMAELQENLRDIYKEVQGNKVPFIRRTMSLSI